MNTARRRSETLFQFVKLSDLLQSHPCLIRCSTTTAKCADWVREKHDKCDNLQSSVLCTVCYSSHLYESAQGHHALFCTCLENSALIRSSHHKSYVG